MVKGSGSGLRMESVVKEAAGSATRQNRARSLEELMVVGLKQSKAASNRDGGVKDLLAFLERKATGPETPATDAVRIRKVCGSLRCIGHQSLRNIARLRSTFVTAKLPSTTTEKGRPFLQAFG